MTHIVTDQMGNTFIIEVPASLMLPKQRSLKRWFLGLLGL